MLRDFVEIYVDSLLDHVLVGVDAPVDGDSSLFVESLESVENACAKRVELETLIGFEPYVSSKRMRKHSPN